MEKENIILLAQLFTAMKDAVEALGEAQKKEDMEKMTALKKEVLYFQREIDRLL